MTLTLSILLAPLIVLSALFSGSETALFSLTHADRVRLKRERPGTARAVSHLLASPKHLLLTILMLNTAVNVTYFVVSTVLLWQIESPAAAGATAVGTLLAIILFGEVLAKLLAAAHRALWCGLFARPMLVVVRSLTPIRAVIDHFALSPLSRLVSPQNARPASLSAQELDALLAQSAGQGDIDAGEQDLLAGVVWLGQSKVRDAMTHRTEMDWLSCEASLAQTKAVVAQVRRTRIPVRDMTPEGGVIGMLNVSRYFAAAAQQPARAIPIKGFVEPVGFLPESATLDQVLGHFRASGTHVAICVDEHGSVTGMIEIEDTVERLLPLADAADELKDDINQIGPGCWSVPARLRVHDWLREAFSTESAAIDPRVSTVGGLVIASLGRLAQAGDCVHIGAIRLEVESVSGPVIERVKVSLEQHEEAVHADGADEEGDR
jgi:magnesium and cobalt exporter, CNNM family